MELNSNVKGKYISIIILFGERIGKCGFIFISKERYIFYDVFKFGFKGIFSVLWCIILFKGCYIY